MHFIRKSVHRLVQISTLGSIIHHHWNEWPSDPWPLEAINTGLPIYVCVSLDYKLAHCIVLDLYNTGSNCTPAIYSIGDLHSTIITYRCNAAIYEHSVLFGMFSYVFMRAVHRFMIWREMLYREIVYQVYIISHWDHILVSARSIS